MRGRQALSLWTVLIAGSAALGCGPVSGERARQYGFAGTPRAPDFVRVARDLKPAVVSVDTHAAVALLEDRIAFVDDVLSHESVEGAPASHIAALQRERARLVDSLVQVRYAESLAAVAR